MTYSTGGLIQASDFNTRAGDANATSSGSVNAVWATGGGTGGYGQTAVANVVAGGSVAASNWSSLVNTVSNIGQHQGTGILSMPAPAVGGSINYLANLDTNLTSIYSSRLNANAQGSTSSNAVTYGSTWINSVTFTHTVTFANGNAARYFFNAGGQIKMTVGHSNTTAGINALFNTLCTNTGTVAISAPSSGSITIASTSYNGVTKVGGGGNAPTISTNSGYYGLTTANTTIFTQTATGTPSGYTGSYISYIAKTNGAQGSNSDNGSVITIYTVWDEVPNGLTMGAVSTTTLTIAPPSTAYVANTWGAITLAGSATGS